MPQVSFTCNLVCVTIMHAFTLNAVETSICIKCSTKKYFDGQKFGVLNMGKFLVSYEVLRTFMHQFLLGRYCKLIKITFSYLITAASCYYYNSILMHLSDIISSCRTTIYTQYCVLTQNHKDAGSSNFSSLFTYNHYRLAWYSFLELMDIDYSTGFTCSECGTAPTTVVMDATSVAFRKDLLPFQFCETQPSDLSIQKEQAGR